MSSILYFEPGKFASVQERQNNDSPLTIVLLMEVYGDPTSQRNAAAVVKKLHEEHGITWVYRDEASGLVDTANITTARLMYSLFGDIFMEGGTPIGAELLLLENDLPINLFGVDNLEMHRKHHEQFKEVQKAYPSYEWIFDLLSSYIDFKKEQTYSPRLRAFDELMSRFNKQSAHLNEVMDAIVSMVDDDVISWDEFPILERIQVMREMTSTIDIDQGSLEQRALVQALLKVLASQEFSINSVRRLTVAYLEKTGKPLHEAISETNRMDDKNLGEHLYEFLRFLKIELLSKTVELKQDKISKVVFYDYLVDISALLDVDIPEYPNLRNYLRYLHAIRSTEEGIITIGADELNPIMRAESTIRSLLLNTDEEKTVARIAEQLTALQDLMRLMYHQQARVYDFNIRDLTLSKLLCDKLIKALVTPTEMQRLMAIQPAFDSHQKTAKEFYNLTRYRSETMVTNTITHMNENGILGGVLSVGGYLQKQVTTTLQQKRINFLVLHCRMESGFSIDTYVNNLLNT